MEIAPIRVLGLSWVKGPAKIENGEVVLDVDRAEEYEFLSPEASERMAFELASLPWHTRDEREVKRFVRLYGLLSHGAEDLKRGENRESLEDWWNEAMALHFVGACYQTLSDSKVSGSAKKIKDFLRQFGYGFQETESGIADLDRAYMTEVSIWLANLINAGLNGRRSEQRCVWGLNAVGPGAFRLTQHPPDLVSRAYAAFATLIANSAETRFCKVCAKQFRPRTKRSWACSDAHAVTLRSRRSRAKNDSAE